MKLTKILMAGILSVSFASAQEVMQKSMSDMDTGMNLIQKGFMHNNLNLIKDGMAMVKRGNDDFSDPKLIKK